MKNTEASRNRRLLRASYNLSALIDESLTEARRNFRQCSDTKIDIKFVKECVSTLKGIFELLGGEESATECEGIIVRIEDQLREWCK